MNRSVFKKIANLKLGKLLTSLLVILSFVCIPVLAQTADDSAAAIRKGNSQTTYAYVGCRTTKERNAHGEGINVYRVDSLTGNWTHVQLIKTPQENPSFLALDRDQHYLYSVHGDFGEVSSYKIDSQTGELAFLNMESTQGKNPVHLVVEPSNRVLTVANYATGSLVLLPINDDGSLSPVADMVQLQGNPGPHKTQQGSSHPHQVMLDSKEKFLLVPDKGLDKVFTFKIDADKQKIIPATPPAITAREGAGTRHIALLSNKPYAYVANELDSTITTYRYNEETGELKPLQIIPSIPSTFTGNNTAAEIMLDYSGKFLYVSNRGHDSIGIYTIDKTTGLPSPIGWESSQGKGPRFFTIDPSGNFLYAANENSDTIVTFRINHTTGKLTPTGQIIKTGSPVCIIFSKQ